MHYNSIYKMFFITSLLFSTSISNFLKKFAFLTGILIVCLQPEGSGVLMVFIVKMRKITVTTLPRPILRTMGRKHQCILIGCLSLAKTTLL